MTVYTAETLDLSRIGAPTLVPADYDTVKAERLAHFASLWAARRIKNPSLPDIDVLGLETEPAVLLTEEYSYADTLLRHAINDAAATLRLATAGGADLRHLAKTYANTEALVIDPGDPNASPPRAPVYESDAELRERAQLAPEAFPEFGLTAGGYVYRVRRQFGDTVKGVRAIRRGGGRMDLFILARSGDGTPPETLIGDIQAGFDGEGDFQSTDIVTVKPARIVPYQIAGTLRVLPGPDPERVKSAALLRLAALAVERHRLTANVPRNQIEAAALGSPAVAEDIVLTAPLAGVIGGADGAPYCTGITLTTEIAA